MRRLVRRAEVERGDARLDQRGQAHRARLGVGGDPQALERRAAEPTGGEPDEVDLGVGGRIVARGLRVASAEERRAGGVGEDGTEWRIAPFRGRRGLAHRQADEPLLGGRVDLGGHAGSVRSSISHAWSSACQAIRRAA